MERPTIKKLSALDFFEVAKFLRDASDWVFDYDAFQEVVLGSIENDDGLIDDNQWRKLEILTMTDEELLHAADVFFYEDGGDLQDRFLRSIAEYRKFLSFEGINPDEVIFRIEFPFN